MAVVAGVTTADWERFEVPEGYRAEIIAGELVVTPSAGAGRQMQSGLTRIAAKRADYARSGLAHHVEVSRGRDGVVTVERFELRDGRLVTAARAAGDEWLESELPFRYSFRPADLRRR